MKKENEKMKIMKYTIAVLACLLVLMTAITVSTTKQNIELLSKYNSMMNTQKEQEAIQKDEEVKSAERPSFDTSALDAWCGTCNAGTVRMVRAWLSAEGQVEDETGNLWDADTWIMPLDNVLMWIADNHTPDNVEDDIVLKVWVELHD